MHQDLGSWSREFMGVMVRTLKGPWQRGLSLALGCVVQTLVPSSHTCCSTVNFWKANIGPLRFMTLAVTCRVADFAADPIKGFEMVFYCRKMGGKIDRRNE